ncbi:hypothetical protein GCM10010521_55510 [Streptomyces rameus]|uniref:Cytochrome P450 n=1 Tax=Streptomyces rameus TaxID=68261 RepID=A0ABP6HE76_9ACTN
MGEIAAYRGRLAATMQENPGTDVISDILAMQAEDPTEAVAGAGTFDADRKPNTHTTFEPGPRVCIGVNLAVHQVEILSDQRISGGVGRIPATW